MNITDEVNKIIEDKGLKPWRISKGLDDNPFPIGMRSIYNVALGKTKGMHPYTLMTLEKFIKEQLDENKDIESV